VLYLEAQLGSRQEATVGSSRRETSINPLSQSRHIGNQKAHATMLRLDCQSRNYGVTWRARRADECTRPVELPAL